MSQETVRARPKPTEARPIKDNVGCPKALIEKVSGLQAGGMSRYMATLPKSAFPRSVVLLLGMKGGHFPTPDEQHRGNRVLKTCWAFITKGVWPAASRDALFK